MNVLLVMVIILIAADSMVYVLRWLLKIFKKRYRRCLHVTTFHLILVILLISTLCCFTKIANWKAGKSKNILFELCYHLNSKLLWSVNFKLSPTPFYVYVTPLVMYYVYQLHFKEFPTRLMAVSVGINGASFLLFYLTDISLKYDLSAVFILAVIQIYHVFMECQQMISSHFGTRNNMISNIIILLSSISVLCIWIYVYIVVIPFLYAKSFLYKKLWLPSEMEYLFISYYIVEMLLYPSPIDYLQKIFNCITNIYHGKTIDQKECTEKLPENHHSSESTQAQIIIGRNTDPALCQVGNSASDIATYKATMSQMIKCIVVIQRKLKRIRQLKKTEEKLKKN